MKRAFLLIVVPALLVALGFSQTPTPSVNTDQTNIKGCLGGSDGNYTVAEDNTGHTFKITTSGVDLKQYLGHDVTLIGQRATGATSAAADNSFAVTELTMISDHCAAAAVPSATVSTPSETASAPASPPAPAVAAPTTSTSTFPETEVAPAADASATAAKVATPPEPTLTPAPSATPPAELTVTPTVAPTASAATDTTVSDKPVADAVPPTRRSKHLRSESAAPVATAAAVVPAVTASNSSEPATIPDVTASTPAANSTKTATTSDAAPITTPARHGALGLLIAFAVLVILLGIFVPFLSRWRKQKNMARTDAPNLSFTREATTDQDKKDFQGPSKAA